MAMTRRKRSGGSLGCVILWWLCGADANAQDLEPRRWTHLPTGMNIVGMGTAWTDGEIFLDPVLRLEDASFELYSVISSYMRTYDWFGKSGRIDFRLPYAHGRWEGLLDGEDVSTRRHGFSDPAIRVSLNLYGAPPLRGVKFVQYRAQHPVATTVGAALALTLPLGEYYAERLINLGNNRYVLRAQLGVLHQRGPWQFELTGTASFYQDNDEFFGGTRLGQDPLWFVQGHVIRALQRGMWVGMSGGFSFAGESQINGVPKDNEDRTRYVSLSLGMPITTQQSVKMTWINAETNVLVGTSSNSLAMSWTFNWGL